MSNTDLKIMLLNRLTSAYYINVNTCICNFNRDVKDVLDLQLYKFILDGLSDVGKITNVKYASMRMDDFFHPTHDKP